MRFNQRKRTMGQVAAALGLQLAILAILGRRWWCEKADLSPITVSAWDVHTSQHFLDPYSFSHLQHGIIFFAILTFLRRPSLLAALVVEISWEILENTPLIIDRYRTVTASLGYSGDSMINSLGDTLCCVAGYVLASKLGRKRTFVLYCAVELMMLFCFKDSLTLNVIMLLYPIDAIRAWQTAGIVI